MKRLFVCALVAMAAFSASAQMRFPMPPPPEPDPYTIKTGDLSMTIDAGQGAKVTSFTCNGKEVISQIQRFNAWGSTFWTSPQSEWNWPPVAEYDRMPYEVEQKEDVLVMTSKVSERFQYQIRKEFRANGENAFTVTYSIINHAAEARRVAPWEITRVLSQGVVFFECPVKEIEAAAGEMIPFEQKYGMAWYGFGEEKPNRKANADGQGWLAYCNDSLLLVKKFPNLIASQPAPAEAEIQIYVNEGNSFTELESQGAYTLLQPGQELKYDVTWYLVPVKESAAPSKKIVKAVKALVK